MRITGIHVGTQGFTEYLLNLGVSSLPLVDLTGRHTTSSTGVTISGNVAVYNGGSTSYTTVSGSDLDFNWATSFYVVGVFTLSSLAGYQTLWDTHEGLNYTSPQRFGVFTNPDGHLSLYNNGTVIATTSPGVVVVGVPATILVFRAGTTCYVYVNGTPQISVTFSTPLDNINRRMYIGGSQFSANQFNGTISDFKVIDMKLDNRVPFVINWVDKIDWLNCQFSTATGLTDSSTNNHSFTQYGTPAIGTFRHPGGALDLNGSSSLSTVSAIAFGTQPYAISADIFIETGSNTYSLFLGQRADSGNTTFELLSHVNTKVICINSFSNMGAVGIEYLGITRNAWHTVQVERLIDGTLKLGWDGYLIAQGYSLGHMISRIFNIGTDNTGDNTRATTGSIKNLRIATLNLPGWDITTTSTSYTTTDDITGFTLRTDEANPGAVKALKRTKYIGNHSMTGKFTSSNIITANTTASGITLVFFINCYDSLDNYLDRVGLFVVFTNIGAPVLIANCGATGNGTFSAHQISNQVIGATLDTSLTYTLNADTHTKQWGWTCSDGYSVDGDSLIGLLHASTSYVRFSIYEQVNTGITGIAEAKAISFV